MKKKILLTFILTFSLASISTDSFAQTPTPEVSKFEQQINEIKEKVASRVAELNLVEKRGIIGKVVNSSDTQITISDSKGSTRFVDVDELTKFYAEGDSSFGISDIKPEANIGILGIYNKESKRILARKIDVLSKKPEVIFAAVTEIDDKNFEISAVKENGQKIVASVETTTKTSSFSNNELEKSGFSRLEIGQAVIIVGTINPDDKDKITSQSLLILPDIDTSSKFKISEK